MTEQTGPKGSTRDDSRRMASRMDGLKAEFERVKNSADEVKSEIAAATDARRGGPATSVDDATAKAAELRRGMERDVAALRARVPERDAVTGRVRTVGTAVGGGILALATIVTLFKRRSSTKEHDAAVREQALAIARAIARLEPEDIEKADGGGRLKWLALASVVAGAGTLAWRRSSGPVDVDDEFVAPEEEPLRPPDAVS